jgi:type I restriction-modification system DNA methylase subunit
MSAKTKTTSRTTPTRESEQNTRTIVKNLRANTGNHDMHTVFSDFCAMVATAIRNTIDRDGYQAREDDYLARVARYTPEQLDRFANVLAHLGLELERSPRDVLGEVYMGLEIAAREQGQFFTPWHVCELMAAMNFSDAKALLTDAPFLTLYEPACGAGAMVLAATQTLAAQGINFQQQLHVTADDINPTAVHMAYIQFSLMGIPALVHHRNALSLEHFDTWATPMHVLGGWSLRLAAAGR